MSVTSSGITPYSSSNNVFPSSSFAPNPNTKVFFGFSTKDTDKTGKTNLYDIELINRDLLNIFYTRVGERVMRPDFGNKIWEWLFDPLTPALHDMIVAECVRIVQTDIRLILLNTDVFDYDSGIRIELTLQYLPYNVVNTFTATFEQRQATYFGDNANLIG